MISQQEKREYLKEWVIKNPEKAKAIKRRYYLKNKEKYKKWKKEYSSRNPEKIREWGRKANKKWSKANRASINARQNRRMAEIRAKLAGRPQTPQCEICAKICTTVFDHDHGTGKFRGWLCIPCNGALGMVNDSQEILEKMIEYLKFHSREAT